MIEKNIETQNHSEEKIKFSDDKSKKFFHLDKKRTIWFFLSIPLSALLSLLLFLLLENLFSLHVPLWFYFIFVIPVSYNIGYLMDNLHSSLEERNHRIIFYTIKTIVIIVSIIFLIALISGFYAMTTVTMKKPAIYLYPEQNSIINVKLDVNGKIIKDIPKYNNGWDVFVTNEGIIENKYDYLFYEADLRKLDLPNEGWIVEYSKLNSWFNQNLIKLGLNEKEIYQFKEYWMKELPNSKYYEIKLLEDNFLRDNMNLIIEPQPETIIRINFHFKPLNEKYPLPLKKISNKKRLGFTVVEWGGILQE